jgi:putative nucleotidyltransferase with HDIG domain
MALMVSMLERTTADPQPAPPVPMRTTLDSRLIVRESCGCTMLRESSDAVPAAAAAAMLPDPAVKCREQIVHALQDISFDRSWKSETELADSLMDTYREACRSCSGEPFLDLWREFISNNFHLEVDEVIINGIVQLLRGCCAFEDARNIRENLFWSAMSLLEKKTLQHIRKTYNTAMRDEFVLNQLRDQLDIRFDQSRILDIIHHNLMELGITTAYMAMYEQDSSSESAHMILAYSGEMRHPLSGDGLAFTLKSLIPDRFFADHERFSFMVEALYYGERQVGFLMLDMSRHIDSIHTDIRRIVSSIFRSVDLVNKIQDQKTELIDSIARLRRTLEGIIKTLSITVENKDPYTAGHQRRVADLSMGIGREMNLDNTKLDELRVAALLHDIGKIYIPSEILNKPGKLKPIEFQLIKLHAEDGYTTLKNIEFPWPIAEIVFEHHERCDGSGYPRGLRGDEILLTARILAVADVVEAITSMRPYREALGFEAALAEISTFRGIRYDTDVVEAALRLFRSPSFKMPEA